MAKQKKSESASVRIAEDLRAEAKVAAAKRRVTLQAYIEEAIREKMKGRGAKPNE